MTRDMGRQRPKPPAVFSFDRSPFPIRKPSNPTASQSEFPGRATATPSFRGSAAGREPGIQGHLRQISLPGFRVRRGACHRARQRRDRWRHPGMTCDAVELKACSDLIESLLRTHARARRRHSRLSWRMPQSKTWMAWTVPGRDTNQAIRWKRNPLPKRANVLALGSAHNMLSSRIVGQFEKRRPFISPPAGEVGRGALAAHSAR